MANNSAIQPIAVRDLVADVNGDAIPYLAAGEGGRVVLLIHGGAGDRLEWADVAARLAAAGRRAIAPDLIGFGGSPRRDVPHTIPHLAEFAAEFMASVGVERATLAGHSLGGRVCLEVALNAPLSVDALALVAPLGFGGMSTIGRTLGMAAWWLDRAMRRRPPYPKLEVDMIDPNMEAFASVERPTLVAWGTRDIYFPLSNSRRALEAMPSAKLSVYEGAGHAPHRSDPRRFASELATLMDDRRA